jgi:hypothetical protein
MSGEVLVGDDGEILLSADGKAMLADDLYPYSAGLVYDTDYGRYVFTSYPAGTCALSAVWDQNWSETYYAPQACYHDGTVEASNQNISGQLIMAYVNADHAEIDWARVKKLRAKLTFRTNIVDGITHDATLSIYVGVNKSAPSGAEEPWSSGWDLVATVDMAEQTEEFEDHEVEVEIDPGGSAVETIKIAFFYNTTSCSVEEYSVVRGGTARPVLADPDDGKAVVYNLPA